MTPNYETTYVFQNDFPALLEETPSPPLSDDPLFQMSDAKGTCRVMCFHPKTNKTLPVMTLTEIGNVIDEYVFVKKIFFYTSLICYLNPKLQFQMD